MRRKKKTTAKDFDYAKFEAEALEQIASGKPLVGHQGVLTPMIKQFVEKALEGELEAHLDEHARNKGNKRNGRTSKMVKSSVGSFQISTPRDRNGDFTPELLPKRQGTLGRALEEKIIALYGLGMSYRDIRDHIAEMYGTELSSGALSQITDTVIPQLRAWQGRPLDPVYTIVWLDAMHYKVRQDGRVLTKAVYTILGVDTNGYKQLLGLYLSQSESASFWLSVLNDLQHRGVQDILISCIDNLKGFAEALEVTFPQTRVQTCVIHQIRNSLKYVASRDSRAFMKDLKLVYKATNLALAEQKIEELDEKWGEKYPIVIKSWRNNWPRLSTYFEYNPAIAKLIYTTNAVEGVHRQIRKVTKTKGAFSSDMALLKLVYLASQRVTQNWSRTLPNWTQTISQLKITFGDRLPLDIDVYPANSPPSG